MSRPLRGQPRGATADPSPGRHRAPRHGWATRRRIGLAATAALVGTVTLMASASDTVDPATAATPLASAGRTVLDVADERTPTSPPVRVRVPSIGVDSALVELGLDGAGALEPPADFDRAGWYTGSAAPGEIGPSVIAGHVDSYSGPAVFVRLGDLAPGDDVLVDRADGTTVRFTVTDTQRHPKDDFPTEEVYGPTVQPVLRLITCGGEFDRDRRSYRDNVVVTAVLAG